MTNDLKRPQEVLETMPSQESPAGLSRRDFVKIVGIGVLAPGLIAGCADTQTDETPPTAPQAKTAPVNRTLFPQSVLTGDPRPDSMVFWTRLQESASGNLPVKLTIAKDADFNEIVMTKDLMAMTDYDRVVKVKITGLSPRTTYYYQFSYSANGSLQGSPIGRTKTAPLPSDDVPVKFALASCQDYVGRYYNSYLRLAEENDLDFFVHLGDYIYETTGDPSFQTTSPDRIVKFSDPSSSIQFEKHQAAKSISNYRDLYKIYRSDPMLQKVHEKMPMIAIWDDHEFSDDSWQDNGTYQDERLSEKDTTRKRNAERVYSEFMPIDWGLDANGMLAPQEALFYPNTRIYRDFIFGKNVHLVMTDTRTFRADHQISEGAFPGKILVTQAELLAVGQKLDSYPAYVNIDASEYAAYKTMLINAVASAFKAAGTADAEAQAIGQQQITGNISVRTINEQVQAYNKANASTPLTEITIQSTMEKGLSYKELGAPLLGKGQFAADGVFARYVVRQDTYDILAAVRFQKDSSSQNIFGATQESWFKDTMSKSTATWKVMGTSISFTPMLLNLSKIPSDVPESAKTGAAGLAGLLPGSYYFNVDQWDGFPNKKKEVMDFLRTLSNPVVISGDIHSAYATDHGGGLVEFTGTGISSEGFKGFVRGRVGGLGLGEIPGMPDLIENLEKFLQAAAPEIKYATNQDNGFVILSANAQELTGTFYHINEKEVKTNYYSQPDVVRSKFFTKSFTVKNKQLVSVG